MKENTYFTKKIEIAIAIEERKGKKIIINKNKRQNDRISKHVIKSTV